MSIIIKTATSVSEITAAKHLFQEYAKWLNVDLCFQNFDQEMETFPASYKHVLIAKHHHDIIGAVGLREQDSDTCEMKRLYVKPSSQGKGAGKKLCTSLINYAQQSGYKRMLLDSIERLEIAIALYRRLGFQECAPYALNPEEGAIYMQLDL